MRSRVPDALATRLPESSYIHAAWKPSTAFGVAQTRLPGTKLRTMVHADRQVPSMTTVSPELRICRKRAVYSSILPPLSSLRTTIAEAEVTVSADRIAAARSCARMVSDPAEASIKFTPSAARPAPETERQQT